ncbi:hypothetical protein ABLN87_12665 [Ruegeria sp. SCPT10]|uniref:hypothetical protein n=1 Tax=Ruegeria sp. SCP10 TaxID=3141377 RepID=UPI00333685FE
MTEALLSNSLVFPALLHVGAFDIAHLFNDDPNIHYTHAIAIQFFLLMLLFTLTSPLFLLGSILAFCLSPRIIDPERLVAPWAMLLAIALLLSAPMGFSYILLGVFLVLALLSLVALRWMKSPKIKQEYLWQPEGFRNANLPKKTFALLILGLLLYFLKSLATALYFSAVPLNTGQPEFQLQFSHRMNISVVRASYRFPDTQSCLESGADAGIREDLLRMDWDEISTTGDAKVCMFRLLHEWGGVAEAASWLEAQGFRVGENFNSEKPYENRDGTLRVDGGWSIKRNGPRFPTSGIVTRILKAVPYGMGVRATFSEDGEELLYLNIDFSTL